MVLGVALTRDLQLWALVLHKTSLEPLQVSMAPAIFLVCGDGAQQVTFLLMDRREMFTSIKGK